MGYTGTAPGSKEWVEESMAGEMVRGRLDRTAAEPTNQGDVVHIANDLQVKQNTKITSLS